MIYVALTEAERDATLSAIRDRIRMEHRTTVFGNAPSVTALDMQSVASKLEGWNAPKDRWTV